MVKKSIDAKVRPLANPALEKATLLGAARIYVSKDSIIALTNSLENGRPCVVEKLEDDAQHGLLRREASLWVMPEKNLSPNVVVMTRAFQEATGFKIGDQTRISLLESMPDAEEVVVHDLTDEPGTESEVAKHPACWEFALSLSIKRAELVFPGMVFDGVIINKLRRSFKVISVNSHSNNIAKFKISSTAIRIVNEDEQDAAAAEAEAFTGGDLVVTGVPGLTSQVGAINRFLKGFTRPFWVKDERESCGYILHGGHGTGKTFILQRLADCKWGRPFWIKPSDKLSTVRETFKQAYALQPCMVLIDSLEELISKDRTNREAVIEAIAEELDALSAEAKANSALPRVVVIATCQDYMTDVPAKLQKRSRFRENTALPIPRASERLEILEFFDPPIRPDEKKECLASMSQKTHAYNGDDLANLVLNAKKILGNRLDESGVDLNTAGPQFLSKEDMEQALRTTRPTAMHDINLKPPTIHWQDVGGQESLKKVLSRMIKNTKNTNPSSRHVLRNPPKGLLLYGPPGCSKTLSAQAMATESGFNFFAVKGAELLNMYVGESERAVRTLFERARAASPSIIFFDEIDSIGGQRGPGSGSSSGSRSTGAVNMLTTLLTEMDGFESLTGVLVLAATNRPEAMDPALMRPGRFDQVLYVGPPDQAAREAVFRVHLKGLAVAEDVDVKEVARKADRYSGAEIKAICNEAGLAVLDRYDDDETGTAKLEIGMADLEAAIARTPQNITEEMIEAYEDWAKKFRPK
ncbi:AAA+-type ATPase [Conoideocrella luteorostrata]|uniref:AAA+-type ATPase n=1 Tax=Conoideocrella luteorostrata TaxID=1105319 RepID=A0AAJ0CDU6_9HYPO|nr:AAA+-type ATPase [Conoideocrella luteorostrata]